MGSTDQRGSPLPAFETALQVADQWSRGVAPVFERPEGHHLHAWEGITAAHALTEQQLGGVALLHDSTLPERLLCQALGHMQASANRYEAPRHVRHQAVINGLLAATPLEWFCNVLQRRHTGIDSVLDTYLDTIVTSLAWRVERFVDEQAQVAAGLLSTQESPPEQRGYLFEALTLGLVTKGERFRKTGIVALPASPVLEKGSSTNPYPVDVALWRVTKHGSSELVGGIQCRSGDGQGRDRSRWGKGPSDFMVKIFARRHFHSFGATVEEIITTWLNGDQLVCQAMHDIVLGRIEVSGNTELKRLLGLSDSETVLQEDEDLPALAVVNL